MSEDEDTLTRPEQEGVSGMATARRMMSLLARCTTRPGREMRAKRSALRRLWDHGAPPYQPLHGGVKVKASTAIAHQAALAPNRPEGSRPPAKSFFSTP